MVWSVQPLAVADRRSNVARLPGGVTSRIGLSENGELFFAYAK